MKTLILVSVLSCLCSCVTGRLVRVDDPSVTRQMVQDFSAPTAQHSLKSYHHQLRYVESPFAQAVLRTKRGLRYVDVKKQDAASLSMKEGQMVTLSWIP